MADFRDTDCADVDLKAIADAFVTAHRGATAAGGHAVVAAVLVMVVDHDTQRRRWGWGVAQSPCLGVKDFTGMADEMGEVLHVWAKEKNAKNAT